MPRVLVARSANEEFKVLLDKERLTIGRDKKCDLFLDDEEVSRKHAAVLFKFGAIYIENISPTGQIFRGNDVVEYTELESGDELRIGRFVLSWKEEVNPSLNPVHLRASDLPSDVASHLDMLATGDEAHLDHLAPVGKADQMLAHTPEQELGAAVAQSNEAMPDFMLSATPDLEQKEVGAEPFENALIEANPPDNPFQVGEHNEQALVLGAEPFPSPSSGNDATQAFTGQDSTKISVHELPATLRIMEGEIRGREIHLGTEINEWVVGRGSKCDISIENSKLSRQHFKIIREGRSFKIIDLQSAAGTRLNGLSVSENHLKSFDTIKIGPVQIQFIIGEEQKITSGSVNLLGDESTAPGLRDSAEIRLEAPDNSNSTQEKTAFAAPIPYSPQGYAGGYQGGGGSENPGIFDIPNYRTPNPDTGYNSNSARPSLPENSLDKVKKWANGLNQKQKIIYAASLAIIVGVLALKLGSSDEVVIGAAPESADRNIASVTNESDTNAAPSTKESNNAAITGDVNSKFFQLSPEKRRAIEDSYAKAERSYQDKNWNDSYKFAKEVLDQVDPYKKASDILYESQLQKNSNMLGNVSTNLNNVNDAARENAEKIEVLVEAGDKALSEQRWEDAEENFRRAVTLDPNDQRAQQGYFKALKKDMSVSINLPDAQVQNDPIAEERARISDEFVSLRKVYSGARQKILTGSYGAAIQTLKQLDFALRERVGDFKSDRAPAAIREFGIEQSTNLQLQIREALDNAKTQLEVEYQTQLADAEAFTSNKQYIQAKDIYNKIIRLEPEFDKVKSERSKLHAKILSEAKEKYQEALIYETVGDIEQAVEGYDQTRELLQDVDDSSALEYFKKAQLKLRRLKR